MAMQDPSAKRLDEARSRIGKCDGRDLNLSALRLESDELAALMPKIIRSLRSLQTLNLADNRLSTLPPQIVSLTSLQTLYIGGNQFSTLPPEIGSLTALKVLSVSRNRLTSLPPEIGSLTSLQSLYLYQNQLANLPKEIRKLESSLKQLYLHDNPKLGLSLEVLGPTWQDDRERKNAAKPSAILAAYFGAQVGHALPLNEVKLLFVGHGRVGKTCLIKALRGEPFDAAEPETPGIERHRLLLKKGSTEYTAHVWDFGGQEFLHHTHQFFFSARSIYVVVLNERLDRQDAEAEYWLRLVRTYGPGSPVVLVLNQISAHPFEIDEYTLRERFPEIKAVLKTDCHPNTGIDTLRETLATLTGEVEGVDLKIDPRWARVRTRLETMETNFVPYDGYRTICSEEGVTDSQEQDALATILNCLGIALNYRDDPRLRDTSVLKPQWLVDGIYGVLRWMQKLETKGIIQQSDLKQALPDIALYPLNMHRYLLDLMAKFELSFELDATGEKCLVPGLLSPNQPVELKRFVGAFARHVQFRYSELRPPGLMPQFIVRSHTLSEGNPRWQRGVVLKRGSAEVLVRADAAQLVTDVYALGEAEDRVWLTEYVYSEMRQLNGKLPVKTFVESETQPGVWSEWETLRADTIARVTERRETRDGGATVTISPSATLLEVESTEATHAGGDKPLPLFVCYSHADERLVRELVPTLKILANRGYVRSWRDTDLVPGEDWDETIKARLFEAEIVLYMVTTKFIASDYILNQERPISMAQRAAGKADVLPVLLRASDYKGEDFEKLEMLPFKGKTLDSYQPHDGGWTLVQRGIQKAVERRRANRS